MFGGLHSTYSKDPGESGAGWRPYSTYSTYSMELGESGAKFRDICAVLRHEMLFLQGVYSYTAWRNSCFCTVLHGFSPRWFDWFAQPALDTGSPSGPAQRVWGGAVGF